MVIPFNRVTIKGCYNTRTFGQAVYNNTAMIRIHIRTDYHCWSGLLIAVALNSIKPLRGFYFSNRYSSYLMSQTQFAIGLVFAFMFKGNQNDLTNLRFSEPSLRIWIGLDPIVWIGAGGGEILDSLVCYLVYIPFGMVWHLKSLYS